VTFADEDPAKECQYFHKKKKRLSPSQYMEEQEVLMKGEYCFAERAYERAGQPLWFSCFKGTG